VLIRGGIRGASRRPAHLRDLTPAQTVIAAVLLLHERSVDEIVPKLSGVELEQVIKSSGDLHAFIRRARSTRLSSGEHWYRRSRHSGRARALAVRSRRKNSTLGRTALIRGARDPTLHT
jgi:hypothetical protein